jgi:uncharacterized peroxidase-related enzyme
MSRISPVDPDTATGKAKQLLDGVQSSRGHVPIILRVMAQSPAVLRGHLDLSRALAGGALPLETRERIALAVADDNGCAYCMSAHTRMSRDAGLSEADIRDSRRATSPDPRIEAALVFAREVNRTHGRIDGGAVEAVRAAGWSDEEVVEIVAHVALNIFRNAVAEAFAVEPEVSLVEDAPASA